MTETYPSENELLAVVRQDAELWSLWEREQYAAGELLDVIALKGDVHDLTGKAYWLALKRQVYLQICTTPARKMGTKGGSATKANVASTMAIAAVTEQIAEVTGLSILRVAPFVALAFHAVISMSVPVWCDLHESDFGDKPVTKLPEKVAPTKVAKAKPAAKAAKAKPAAKAAKPKPAAKAARSKPPL